MAVMFSDDVPLDVAELRWVARRRRQKIVGTVDYAAFISETALRTPFGGPAGHRGQLKHLLAARDRGIPVVNVEVAEGGVYLHDDQAEPYAKVLAKLDHIALSVRESQARLGLILKEALSMDWRKSSFSGSGGDCVEVRQDLAAIRDSKNTGPSLTADLPRLVTTVKSGKLNR